jgi:hypothetical protein
MEDSMLHLTQTQFLAFTVALFVAIAIAIALLRATHKTKKVIFHEFSGAEYDLEFLKKGESGKTTEWRADRSESIES